MKLRIVHKRGVVLSNSKFFQNPTKEELEKIKEALTFDNPQYRNALRYSRYSRVAIPPHLMYYTLKDGGIEVPIGFDLTPYSNLKIVDKRVYLNTLVSFPPFVLELRDNQQEAAKAYLSSKRDLSSKNIIQLPTGKGKSILGLYIASQLSCKTLIVVHKDDLVVGWLKDIALAFDSKVKAGIIKAKKREVGREITISTVQTLNRLSDEELDKLYSTFGFVIQDEMHHCPSSSYEVVAKFKAKYRLGLTATPERSDGLDHIMFLYYGAICYKYEDNGMESDILPVRIERRNSSVYFNPVYCKKGVVRGKPIYELVNLTAGKDFSMKDNYVRLSDISYEHRPKLSYQVVDNFIVLNPVYVKQVCEDIVSEFSKGHSCVVFFTQKEHCRYYYNVLKEQVGEDNIGLFYGDNTNNKAVLEKAESTRKFITLTTYAKATEGTNVKQWEVEFLVSSINNGKNTEQALGRIRRVKEGFKINPVIVYDYRFPDVYLMKNHGFTRDKRYREMGFSNQKTQERRSPFSVGF